MFALRMLASISCAWGAIAVPTGALCAGDARDIDRAESLSTRAVKLYEERRFAEAAELFMDAHRLSEEPIQLRNAAKATELAGDDARALERWERYRQLAAGDAEEEGEAQAHARAIRRRMALAKIEVEVQPETAVRTEAPWRTPVVSSIFGTGLLAAAGGTVLWVSAANRLGALRSRLASADESGRITGISYADATAELGGINNQRRASVLLAGAAAAIVVAGISLLLLAEPSE